MKLQFNVRHKAAAFRKLMTAIVRVAIPFVSFSVHAQIMVSEGATKDNLVYIDPTIGNVAQLLEPTRPTVQLPNQMMRMSPKRTDFIDDQIGGFPLMIVSHRLGDVFCIKPLCTRVDAESWKRKLAYDHDLEVIRPWYYSTYLIEDDATVEFVPGRKTGIYRFSFPQKDGDKTLLFNTSNNGVGDFHFTSPDEISGTETYHDDIKVYMYGKFSAPGTPGVVKDNIVTAANEISGKDIKAYIHFAKGSPATIEFKYAVSFISAGQAKKNFEGQLTGTTFKNLQDAGQAAWGKVMQQIQVQG